MIPTPLYRGIADRFYINTRALGAFRILIGATLLLDMAIRLVDVRAFYTDSGVLPRSLHRELFPLLSSLSIHGISGSVLFQIAMFGVAAVFAFTLMIGYRTTTSTVASFVLLFSVQARNPLILVSGDLTLLVLLLFSISLPLGSRYSLDATQYGKKEEKVGGIRAALPLFFITFLVYAVNAVTRLRSETWMSGEAVWRVYGLDSFTVLLGDYMAQHGELLTAINWIWVSLLILSPLLIISKGRLRASLSMAFILAHLGMLITLYLEVFPLANVCGLILFLPSQFWNRLEGATLPTLPREYSEDLQKTLYTDALPAPDTVLCTLRRLATFLSVLLFASILTWAFAYLGYYQPPDNAGMLSELDDVHYAWAVFSPTPLTTDGWYVAPVTLDSGRAVDAYRLSNVSWDRPPELDAVYTSSSWNSYLVVNMFSVHSADMRIREGFARYLCIRADEHYEGSPERIEVYFMREPARYDEDQPQEANKREVISGSCESLTDKW